MIKNFLKRNICARFKDHIWVAYLTEMGSLCSKNQSVRYLLRMINVFTKYTCVKPLKDKKA